MIQPLRTAKVQWIADWIDLDIPAPLGKGELFVLPTCLLVASENGAKLIGQEIFKELDQRRAEALLARLIQEYGTPDSILVRFTEEWDDLAWDTFARNYHCEVAFAEPDKEDPSGQFEQLERLKRRVAEKIAENSRDLHARLNATPQSIAAALVRAAAQVRSTQKKTAMLSQAVKLDRNCTDAMVFLGDIEFQNGNLKQAANHFGRALRMENAKIGGQTRDWWNDRETRTFMRATQGRMMTRWHQGDLVGAISDAEDLFRLNPADHQGIRFLLPMFYLLADQVESAIQYYRSYPGNYPKDFTEPAFLFGWGLAMWHGDDEKAAHQAYLKAMLGNLYIAPLLLDLPEPPIDMWLPNDRSEPVYASEFFDSFGLLWEREPSALRFLRDSYDRNRELIERLIELRLKMHDFQDQRYEPDHESKWRALLDEERRLTGEKTETA